MLKKRVLRRLLPLLFSFCFVFSGFLSVKSYAFTLPLDGYLFWHTNQSDMQLRVYHGDTRTDLSGVMNDLSIDYKNANFPNTTAYNGVTGFRYSFKQTHSLFEFPFDFSNYDYYASVTIVNNASNNALNYVPTRAQIASYVNGNLVFAEMTDISVLSAGGASSDGFTLIGRIPDSIGSYVYGFTTIGGTAVNVPAGDFICNAYIWQVEKGDAYTNADVITAINNQTNQLSSDIGQAADDVQQSIEDQYSGDPETEFSVDDVISQHNEKMGVLSFGSDVMLQFLNMFQSANVGTAELTLPGFNITVENVEYSVWPDYSFNFEQLNEWVPALMSVIRVMLPAFVWLMVLRYCIKVFEDNFLAK